MASLSSLAARKATFLLALIWISSPVAGLRPGDMAADAPWRVGAAHRVLGTPWRPEMASLSSLAARNAFFLLAFIWLSSPVGGLRPLRAARLRTTRMPIGRAHV